MAAVCALLVASHARADAADAIDRLELSWEAPPGCPRVADVRARIRKLTGQTPATGATIQAKASVVRAPSGRLHLTLVVRTGDSVGQREIEANACEDLAGATAVNLALLLRSSAPLTAATGDEASQASADTASDQSSTNATSTPNQPTAKASEASRPHPPATPAPLEHEPRGWRGLLRLPLMAASIGLLPAVSWGAGLAIGVQIEHWNILIDGSAWLRQSLSAPDVLDVGAHLDRMELGLWTCHGFSLGVLELAPCAGLSLQHIWTRGTGAHIKARTAQATWLAPGIGAQTRWSLTSWLSLVASADIRAQTARPSIVVDGFGRIGQTGLLAIGFLLGSEWIL